jgi:hypothetical protein
MRTLESPVRSQSRRHRIVALVVLVALSSAACTVPRGPTRPQPSSQPLASGSPASPSPAAPLPQGYVWVSPAPGKSSVALEDMPYGTEAAPKGSVGYVVYSHLFLGPPRPAPTRRGRASPTPAPGTRPWFIGYGTPVLPQRENYERGKAVVQVWRDAAGYHLLVVSACDYKRDAGVPFQDLAVAGNRELKPLSLLDPAADCSGQP